MKSTAAVLALAALVTAPLAAQDAQPDDRISPAVAGEVRSIADSAAREGLPPEPLLRKAMEGTAKGVVPERILAAVRAVRAEEAQAARELRSAGVKPTPEAVEAGAFALNAGLPAGEIGAVARSSRSPHPVSGSLRSAGTLVAMGVPPAQAVSLVRQWIQAGRSPAEVLLLPDQVQAAMSPGVTPAQAAERISHGGGPPSGQPGNRPPAPPGQSRPHGP